MRRLTYTRRLKPSRNTTITADQIVATHVSSHTTEHSHASDSGHTSTYRITPGIRARLASATHLLLATESAADLGSRRADVDVGNAAIGASR